jgi:hypothetical protein
MAIVPSGRFRLMYAQTVGPTSPANNGAGALAAAPGTAPTPSSGGQRDNVQQAEIGENTDVQEQDQAQPNPDMGQEPEERLMVPEGNDEDEGQKSKPATSLKASVYQMLEQIGLQRRQIDNLDEQLFGQEIDFDTHTVSGHYMIPTYTSTKTIHEKEAMTLAQKIANQFGLSQKMKLKGRNWVVSFTSARKEEVEQGGSSLDDLGGGKGGQQAGGAGRGAQQARKAAFTIGEMIEARRNTLVETMRKIAKGHRQ